MKANNLFTVSLSELKTPTQQNMGTGGASRIMHHRDNPRRSYLQSNQLGPLPLPFAAERIAECQTQTLFSYHQASSTLGSFVLMNTDNLPSGGKITEEYTHKDSVSIKLVGDIGLRGNRQAQVAKIIGYSVRESKRNNQHPLVLVVGDWVYPRGPSEDSPNEIKRIQNSVLNNYFDLTKKCSVRGVLGNHEYGDNQKAADPSVFINLAKQYNMTVDRYGRHSIHSKHFIVELYSIDSTTIAVDDQQVEWIIQELTESLNREQEHGKKTWRLVVSHHPIVSFGLHQGETNYLGSLFDTQSIDFWLSGHEHDIEIIAQGPNNPPTLVSGTGSTQREIEQNQKAAYMTNECGFLELNIHEQDIKVNIKRIE